MIRKHVSPAKKDKDVSGYIFGINSSVNPFYTFLFKSSCGLKPIFVRKDMFVIYGKLWISIN